MPVEIDEKKYLILRTRQIWFAESPYEMDNCDILSFQACRQSQMTPGFIRYDQATLTIDLKQPSETIWNGMDRLSHRGIKRAEKEGISVKPSQDYKAFYRLFNSLRSKKGLPRERLNLSVMKRHTSLFLAERDGELLGAHAFIEDKDRIRSFKTGSKRLDADGKMANLIACANRSLIWYVIQYAKEKGLGEFDFGGYYIGNDKSDPRNSINVFKKSFGGRLVARYNYTKYNSPLVKWFVSLKSRF